MKTIEVRHRNSQGFMPSEYIFYLEVKSRSKKAVKESMPRALFIFMLYLFKIVKNSNMARDARKFSGGDFG